MGEKRKRETGLFQGHRKENYHFKAGREDVYGRVNKRINKSGMCGN